MCAGFAQVTLVDLRSSYQQGCEAKRNKKQQTQRTKTNKTKHKAARATFKVTRKAMKARGDEFQIALSSSCPSTKCKRMHGHVHTACRARECSHVSMQFSQARGPIL